VEHPALLINGPTGWDGEGHLRLLPAWQLGDDLHVPVLSALHVQLAPRQNICTAHHQQGRMGNFRPEEDRGKLHRRRARHSVGYGAARGCGVYNLLRNTGAI